MPPRTYSSAIRDAQVEQTRALLFETARAMLAEGGAEALTLPKLAQAARVSIPTVYRYFPTIDDLFRAFLDWMRPQIGMTAERLMATTPDQLPGLPLENFPRYEAQAAVLRPLMESREFNRVRVQSMRDRAKRSSTRLRPQAPEWSDAELEALSGAVWVFASPQMWRWLRDTWGLESDEAANAASWAMTTLLAALSCGPKTKKRSSTRGETHENSSRDRSGARPRTRSKRAR